MHDFQIINTDTDSILFCKKNGDNFTEEEQKNLIDELNSIMPDLIHWEHDGLYSCVIILKAKNYILHSPENKKKPIAIKGSALKVSNKELAMKECIKRFIDSMLDLSNETPLEIYHSYVKEIHNIKEISRWTSKKTITKAILNPERSNEQKVADALSGVAVQEGEKYRFYFKYDGEFIIEGISPKTGKPTKSKEKRYSLKLEQNWDNDHATEKLLEKLYKNIQVFANVLPMDQFLNYNLKKNQILLNEIIKNAK